MCIFKNHWGGDKIGQLILRRIVKIVSTKCQILRLKCTKTDFGWGSAPDPAGELTALDLRGPISKGRGYRKEGEREGKAWGGRVREGGGGDPVCIFKFSFE